MRDTLPKELKSRTRSQIGLRLTLPARCFHSTLHSKMLLPSQIKPKIPASCFDLTIYQAAADQLENCLEVKLIANFLSCFDCCPCTLFFTLCSFPPTHGLPLLPCPTRHAVIPAVIIWCDERRLICSELPVLARIADGLLHFETPGVVFDAILSAFWFA